ncbi:Protein Y48C3A.20, partial [Aphelenchoides avenae]
MLQVTGLRPSLSSDLTLTVSFANDEFDEKDVEFLLTHFPKEFMSTGKKRKPALDDVRSLFTKVKVTTIGRSMDRETASKYPLTSPSRRCAFTVAFEREQLFVGARYRKFSRDLPQSPWTINAETPKLPGNSVSEKVCKTLETHFAADATRFIASGREDIDVRMLGSGRPFAVQLLNARKVASLRPKVVAETLARLTEEVNKDIDIDISPLVKVSTKQALQLNVGQEEKKKMYSAVCGSSGKITPEMLQKLEASIPLEIVQKTPIRVLKRRPLLDRKRNIFAMKTLQLDDTHFFV